MSEHRDLTSYIKLAADIVSAYVSNNTIPATEVPALLAEVNTALVNLGKSTPVVVVSEAQRPAVSVKRSVTDDHLICLEDGKKFKSLKRHLRTQYNMTPEEYREKWGLPGDYPMVAPAYAKARSQLAKQMGLGQQRRRRK
jgi:predicted transcriptional regulator